MVPPLFVCLHIYFLISLFLFLVTGQKFRNFVKIQNKSCNFADDKYTINMLVTFEKEYLKLLYSTGKSDKKHRFQPEIKLLLPLQCNVVNGCAYKVLGKDLCIKEVDVYSVLAWIISITDMK